MNYVLLRHIRDAQESLQDDLICILDGCDQTVVDNACQAVVDRFEVLVGQLL